MRSRPVFASVVLALPFAAVLAGCPSGGGGSVGGGAPVPADQIGKAITEKVCGAIQTCCTQNGFAAEFQSCSQGAAALQASFDQQRAKHPDYVYDAQKAGNCIAKIAAAYSNCNYKDDQTGDDPDCENFLRGTKPLGAECSSNDECAGNGTNRVDCAGNGSVGSADGGVTETTGVCVALKPAAEGDPCYTFTAEGARPSGTTVYGDCGYGSEEFYCDSATQKCKRRGGAGTTCVTQTGTSTVSDGSVCTRDTTCDYQTKECVALPKVGEDCAKTSRCAEGAYCDMSTRKCIAKKAGGEPCAGSSEECLHGCDTTSNECRTNDVSRKLCSGDLD